MVDINPAIAASAAVNENESYQLEQAELIPDTPTEATGSEDDDRDADKDTKDGKDGIE